jgi:RHS repeat-associated protein
VLGDLPDSREGCTTFGFKGNLISLTKQLYQTYNATINWDLTQPMETDIYTETMSYDALNRLTQHTKPDGTVEAFTYNKAGLPETQGANLRGSATFTPFIASMNDPAKGIDYNEKGQRTDIYYHNGSKTHYDYDANTFRLKRLLTTKNSGQVILQDLNYTYDPEGNIVQQTDNAQQTIYFNNTVVEPTGLYEYDPLYRLTLARGRELASLGRATDTDFPNSLTIRYDGSALQNYIQTYVYDKLGNFISMHSEPQNSGSTPWTRQYTYAANDANNHLVATDDNAFTYDNHGNMLTMNQAFSMSWDFVDMMKSSVKGGNTTWYRYDINGQRVRKITQNGNITCERIYLSGYEIYRERDNNGLKTEIQTVHIDDEKKKIALVETKTINDYNVINNPASVIRFQYDNHLGSACLELDTTGSVISYEEYHPFGTSSFREKNSSIEVSLKRYKYVGKERDEESGLYYYGARYYAAWIARFVSVDPLQHKYPHYTPYQYAGNKPISFIDLDGMEEKYNKSDVNMFIWKR